MIYIESPSHNPYFNMALEEYALTHFDDEVFMLWRNDKVIVVGKNQNTLAEINTDYVKERNIAVVRRLTGGGAVFHDLGNLNFTIILKNEGEWFSNFEKFTAPVIEALAGFGVKAETSGRNDITIDGKKISGNAQLVYKDKILHHGTLLFHANVSDLAAALTVNEEKIRSKGVQSVRSRVANIWDYAKIDIEVFKKKIAIGTPYALTADDLAAVEELTREKYATWDWNYGYSPKYSYEKVMYFTGGTVEFHIDVKSGIMEKVKIYGDFFGERSISELEERLKGIKHNREEIGKVLESLHINDYFLGITSDELLKCMGV